MRSTNEKGAIAELEIATAALKLGVDVYKPLSEHSRADLMFEIGDGLWRVQVKWGRLDGDVIVVHCAGSRLSTSGCVSAVHHGRGGPLRGLLRGN